VNHERALPTVEEVRRRLTVVRGRIEAAGGSTDRTAILAVTKTFPAEVATVAAAVGLVDVGENYAQELVAKAAELGREPGSPGEQLRWHMIGALQRNKVKKLAGVVAVWQTVDRASVAAEIGKRDPGARVFVQVNVTEEAQKSGCSVAEAPALVDRCRELGLETAGLMTIGPTDGSDPRPGFALLRTMAERLELAELSMGMSGDLEAAVAEGSTMIRVGSALFGPRPTA
jgi:pyridoxal phosphate enzyme (YggS family)